MLENIERNSPAVGRKPSCNPHKTLIDVEQLLRWTYQDQAADAVAARAAAGAVGPQGYPNTMEALERFCALGVRVDGGGRAALLADCHPDAEAVHEAVRRLSPLRIGLVMHAAKTDSRPDWLEGEVPRPVSAGRTLYLDPTTKRKPFCCLLSYDPEPEHLAFVRGVYVEWWEGVAEVASMLVAGDSLGTYAVTGPAVPREPWR